MAGFNDPTFSFVGQPAAGADLDTYVQENMQWLAHHASNPAPGFVGGTTTPVTLTTGSWVRIPVTATEVNRGGALNGDGIFEAPVAGWYAFTGAVSITDTLGNKEMRLARNGDENDWIGPDNAYGAGSSAPSRRSSSGEAYLSIGDTVEVMAWTDAPTPGSVDKMRFTARWVGV